MRGGKVRRGAEADHPPQLVMIVMASIPPFLHAELCPRSVGSPPARFARSQRFQTGDRVGRRTRRKNGAGDVDEVSRRVRAARPAGFSWRAEQSGRSGLPGGGACLDGSCCCCCCCLFSLSSPPRVPVAVGRSLARRLGFIPITTFRLAVGCVVVRGMRRPNGVAPVTLATGLV